MSTLDDLLALLVDLDEEELADLIATLPEPVVMALSDDLGAASSLIPADPLHMAEGLIPGFVARPHLAYLSQRIAAAVHEVEAGQSRRLIVEMPPRTGKTTLATLATSAWLLARHPSWPIALVSHDGRLATSWGRQVRRWVEAQHLGQGVKIAPDAGAVGAWETTDGGKFLSISTRESFTGRGVRCLFLDDATKDFVDAHSMVMRDNLWDWWLSVAQTRLEPPYLVIVTQCMTGDTQVLMGDGGQRQLRDVRPGDEVATYEGGRLTTSKVLNWANQGPDEVFVVRMASGRTARANARHPFLTVDENGDEAWVRTDQLQPGHLVVSASSTGVLDNPSRGDFAALTTSVSRMTIPALSPTGQALPVPLMDAVSPWRAAESASTTPRYAEPVNARNATAGQTDADDGQKEPFVRLTDAPNSQSAKGFARLTTPGTGGRPGIGPPPTTQGRAAEVVSRAAMGSRLKSMAESSSSRTAAARSVEDYPKRSTNRGTGLTSSALTTATTLCRCADCSAMTATSSSDAATLPPSSEPPLTTWTTGTDVIAEVVSAGIEDVFDIEVERTHNFIANSLCVSNTRWSDDDLVARLLSREYEGSPEDWERIHLPALAESDDSLGRVEGAPLLSPLLNEDVDAALARWEDVRRTVGGYVFNAMYQQRPSPARGTIFDTSWWRYWTTNESRATSDGRVRYLDPSSLTGGRWLDSWDAAFGETTATTASYVVGQRWVKQGADRFLVAQKRGRWSFTQTLDEMRAWQGERQWGRHVHQRLVEKKANGAAIIDALRREIPGIKPINPTASKEARARAVTPEIESGNVYLPHPADPGNEWVSDALSELREFPAGAHDDVPDALTQALLELREAGRGLVSVPGRMERPGEPGGWRVPGAAGLEHRRRVL